MTRDSTHASHFRVPLSLLSVFLALVLLCLPSSSFGQLTPTQSVDEEVVAFAYAPDGRIAYAVKRVITFRRIEMQRDDIWILFPTGERKRIVNGEKLVKSPTPYSYAIQSMRWSPDGSKLVVEMQTSVVINDKTFETRDGLQTMLLDQLGKEIEIGGGQSIIEGAVNSAWLSDGATVGYLKEAVKPNLLFSVAALRAASGRGGTVFKDSTFSAVSWNLKPGAPLSALAVARSASLTGPWRLVWLDFGKEEKRELTELSGFFGQLALSPSGDKSAYFVDPQTLEVRDLNHPDRFIRLTVAMGSLLWSPDERRILIKRGSTSPKKAASLAWISIPSLESQSAAAKPIEAHPVPVLSDLFYNQFALSPDGRSIAVTIPGRRALQIFPIQ